MIVLIIYWMVLYHDVLIMNYEDIKDLIIFALRYIYVVISIILLSVMFLINLSTSTQTPHIHSLASFLLWALLIHLRLLSIV
jgi:hypothetical protein